MLSAKWRPFCPGEEGLNHWRGGELIKYAKKKWCLLSKNYSILNLGEFFHSEKLGFLHNMLPPQYYARVLVGIDKGMSTI